MQKSYSYLSIFFLISIFSNVNAQVVGYVSEISFLEKNEVTFSSQDSSIRHCLNIHELSTFHKMMQLSRVTKTIDLNHELLTEKEILLETNIRDDWMEAYSKIVVGAEFADIYDTQGQRILRDTLNPEPNDTLTHEQAVTFMDHELDSNFYNGLLDSLNIYNFTVSESNGILIGSSDTLVVLLDTNLKLISQTYFDSSGTKMSETATEFSLNPDNSFHISKITTIEWFLSDSGCCVKKTTIIKRFDYSKTLGSASSSQTTKATSNLKNNPIVNITTISGSNSFLVSSTQVDLNNLRLKVYDLSGKLVLSTNAGTGSIIQLPNELRSGIYIIHISSAEEKFPFVGKIIKSTSGSSF